jgi:hypothetical protein
LAIFLVSIIFHPKSKDNSVYATSSHKPDLFHQFHLVVEELLLYDLAVDPVGNSAELNLEFLACGLDHLSIGTCHGSFEGASEVSYRAYPFTLT